MSWWRRNRWWLPALPVTVAMAIAASAYRVETFWWLEGLHHEAARAEPDRFVEVVDDFEDQIGPTRRTYAVRLAGARPLDALPDDVVTGFDDLDEAPPGSVVWQVNLDFTADPDQDLSYCRVLLVDGDGRRFGGDTTDLLGQVNACVPEGSPGPRPPLLQGDERGVVQPGEERPRSWSVQPLVLLPEGVRPEAVWLSWGAPDYVVLPLPR